MPFNLPTKNETAPDEEQGIYEDYLKEAQAISHPNNCLTPLVWIGLSIVTLLLDYAMKSSIPYITIVTTIGYFVLIYWWNAKAKKRIKEIAERKPGFEKFYSALITKQARSELKIIALVSAGVGEANDRKRELKSENIYKNREGSKHW